MGLLARARLPVAQVRRNPRRVTSISLPVFMETVRSRANPSEEQIYNSTCKRVPELVWPLRRQNVLAATFFRRKTSFRPAIDGSSAKAPEQKCRDA